jgi:hypothetical protein
MALNLLTSLSVNGVKLSFGTNMDAEKFSLSVAIPSWPVELTQGKGKNKKVIGIVDASFSKRSVNDVQDFMDNRIPVDLLEGAIDRNLPGFRSFWRKNGIAETAMPYTSIPIQDENETLTGYENVGSVKEVLSIILKVMDDLTPKNGSVADPELEAKRIFSKSAPYTKLDFSNPAEVFAAWEKTQIENIKRVMEKASRISAEDLKSFCLSKFTDNGVDEDGYLRLKAEKKDKVSA